MVSFGSWDLSFFWDLLFEIWDLVYKNVGKSSFFEILNAALS
jgi:hypothetical protein